MIRRPILWHLGMMAIAVSASAQAIPAFSGADGPGSNATGGRGGDVYHVTKLDFDVNGTTDGTLKYGITHAPAAGRTIVFDVGGTIFQNGGGPNSWFRSSTGNITIAGQTAPGGITIAGVGSKWTGNNLILRNITVRPNQDPSNPNGYTYDGISTQATNSIIDHVSSTWFSDEGISATDAVNNTTVQYGLIGEGLNYNGHAYGSIINTQVNDAPIGYHHNLYAHDSTRSPRLGSETGTGAISNFYNNLIYNWISKAGYSALNTDTGEQEPSRTNMVNNFYLKGASNGTTMFTSAGTQTQIYQAGSLYDSNKDGDFNDGMPVTWSNFSGPVTQLLTPLAVSGSYIESAAQARDRVVAYVGADWWNRSAIDARIIGSVSTGTGAIISTVPTSEWSSVMALRSPDFGGIGGTLEYRRDENYDSDDDGMPDTWEPAYGLNPNVADNNGDFDADGYTNLEEYLNEVGEWPAPQYVVFNAATNNRYAQITNWDIKWQPSRFDIAQINDGTVVVDALGQRAGTLKLGFNALDNAALNITSGWLRVTDELYGPGDGSVVIGADPGATAALNLSGGLLDVVTLSKGAGGTFNFTGGTLQATAVNFSLVNNGGTLAPGHSVGTTTVNGDVTLASGAVAIELASAGSFDKLVVTGNAALGSALNVSLLNGYAPAVGQGWQIITAAGLSGNFSSVTAGYNVQQQGNNLLLFFGLSGDYNGDHVVDARDYTVWRDALGTSGANLAADGDHNGAVDQGDFDIWRNNFGQSFGSGGFGAGTVPEPVGMTLMSAGVLCASIILARRRCDNR